MKWTLPKNMNLAEKFVLRFTALPSENGLNQTHDTFKVSVLSEMIKGQKCININYQFQIISKYYNGIHLCFREQL